MRHAMLAVLAAVLIAGPAAANQCPMLAGQVEAAMAADGVSADTRAAVEILLAEGMRLHEAGHHAESEAVLMAAKMVLGIE